MIACSLTTTPNSTVDHSFRCDAANSLSWLGAGYQSIVSTLKDRLEAYPTGQRLKPANTMQMHESPISAGGLARILRISELHLPPGREA
jgi:hypothetical protein